MVKIMSKLLFEQTYNNSNWLIKLYIRIRVYDDHLVQEHWRRNKDIIFTMTTPYEGISHVTVGGIPDAVAYAISLHKGDDSHFVQNYLQDPYRIFFYIGFKPKHQIAELAQIIHNAIVAYQQRNQ